MDTSLPSLRGLWNLEETSPVRCKGTIFSSFPDETSPLTSKHSVDLSTLGAFCGRYSDYGVKPCTSKLQTSESETSYDVYDRKNTTPNFKCDDETVQVMNSALTSDASTKITDFSSEQELYNLMIPDAKINRNHLQYNVTNKPHHTWCSKVRDHSSSNSRQKFVNSDSQNYQTLITRCSSMTTQQNSGFKVTASEKKNSTSNNVICSAKLDDMRTHLMSEETECSSVIPQEQFIQHRNWNDITDTPGDKISTFWKLGSSTHDSPAVSKQESDGSTAGGQLNPRMRVSLLVPPPADFLISHGESSQSWNKFLQDLDKILESRAEFV
jgi:hypothetical protein